MTPEQHIEIGNQLLSDISAAYSDGTPRVKDANPAQIAAVAATAQAHFAAAEALIAARAAGVLHTEPAEAAELQRLPSPVARAAFRFFARRRQAARATSP